MHAFPRIQPLSPHLVRVPCLSNRPRTSVAFGRHMIRSECTRGRGESAHPRQFIRAYLHCNCMRACLHSCMCLSPPMSFSHTASWLFFLVVFPWIILCVSLDCLSICCLAQAGCNQCKQRLKQVFFVSTACSLCQCCPDGVIVARPLHTPC